MSDRNWEAELAKIDKQLASVSDDQLVSTRKPVAQAAPGARSASAAPTAALPAARHAGGSWRTWMKVAIAVGAAAGLMLWPWPARCGLNVVGYTAAAGAVSLLGVWSAIGTWRHRLGLAHFASLLVTVWGLVLGAREVLPRTGYAVPTVERPGQWSCEGLPALPSPSTSPVGTPGSSGAE
jgi:hypothetical protein